MAMDDDRETNLDRATALARVARERGATIVALPELFSSKYFCRHQDRLHLSLAEPVPGPTSQFLGRLAAELDAVVVGSIFERVEAGLAFNTAVLHERDGTLVGRSRKMHIPQYPLYEEKFYFAPGDTDYPVFTTSAGCVAVPTCWDQWYPEVARIAALRGAHLVVYPTAIGHSQLLDERYRHAWQTVMRGHAVANGFYVAAVNRVGIEGETTFWGSSFVADPFGEVVSEAGDDEEVVVVDLEAERIDQMRTLNHYFRDRRPETYGPLLKRWLATGN